MAQNKDADKTNTRLLLEVEELRRRLAELETKSAGNRMSAVPMPNSGENFHLVTEASQTSILVHDGSKWIYVNPAAVDL